MATIARTRVFLAYRGTSEGQSLAKVLYAQLKDEYDVTFAKESPPGDWGAYIAPKLNEADFFVALMTRDACDSRQFDYFLHEIDKAADLYRERAKPVIIPVRVAHLEPYDYRIGARLTRFQEVEVERAEDLGELVDKVKSALANRPVAPRDTFGAVLGDYTLSEIDRLRLADSHVDLPALQKAGSRLEAGNIVWLVGEPGVANYAARSLAAKTAAGKRNVYVILRGKSWQEVERTLVTESTIVFPDALPSPFLSEETAVSQLAALARLLSRGNQILLTVQEDAFEEARVLMRRFGFRHSSSERLHHASYSIENKLHILETSLSTLARSGEIGSRQLSLIQSVMAARRDGRQEHSSRSSLAEETRQRFEQILERWAPSDIESFLLYHLPDLSRPSDLARVLQRNATLDDEIHAWFSKLDDSVKCFVMTVALVPGLAAPATWERHKIIFAKLRHFDPGLALWPLGLSRKRAAPYVTQDGALGFREERIAEAVRREIARSYREYLIELVPDLQRWTIEEDSVPAEDLLQIRHTVATMIGDAARVQLSDLLLLIEAWASHGDWEVREVAARALERLAADSPSQTVAFELLATWCARGQETQHRVWTAAEAYGRIAARDPRASDSRRAFEGLVELAADSRERVAAKVVLATWKLVGRYPVDALEDLFRYLAHHRKPFVRLRLAKVMNAACSADRVAGERLLKSWVGDTEESLRRVAACCLILQAEDREWRNRVDKGLDRLEDFLASDVAILTDVLIDVIDDEWTHWRRSGLIALAHLVKLEEERGSSALAAAVAKALLEQKDRDVLHFLRADGNHFDRFVVAVRAEDWKRLLATPDQLLTALEAESKQEQAPDEGHRLVEALAGFERTRNALTAALASLFAERHEAIEDVLAWLRRAPQQTVASLSKEVRQQAFSALLTSPSIFIDVLFQDFQLANRRRLKSRRELVTDRLQRMRQSTELWDEVVDTLERLAEPSQETSRRQVIKAFASARHIRPADVDLLLEDPSLRKRKCLNNLRLRARLEAWRPRIVAVAAAVLLGVIAALYLLLKPPKGEQVPTPNDPLISKSLAGTPLDSPEHLRADLEARYEIVLVPAGVVLKPRTDGTAVRTIEVADDFIAVNGERVAEDVLRAWLGEQAEQILRLQRLPLAERQALFD